jgi:DNA-binding CsgD family transcriptional regulator
MLVGRDRERAAIDAAIAQGQRGRNAALAFSGPPGIGKTALLGYAAGRADGMTLLRARGIESEAQIPFASLLELLRPALSLLGQLASPQAAALEQAFALRPGRPQDRFAVAAATLGLLAACAEQQPLLLVLDDIQWFDAPSSEALRFALRRLDADPLTAILAVRDGHRSLLDGTEIETVALHGLSATEARRLRSDLPDAAMQRLIAATDGNPLALLQLAPDLEELALAPSGAPMLVSTRLSAAYLRRAAALDDQTRKCLLLAATSGSGDLQLLSHAARGVGVDIKSLLAAEAAGLVTVAAGHVEFQHPLIRSAVYSDATLGARREAHRALASVLPDRELDSRAWHLAAAAVGSDETAAVALEHAALHSIRRGAYASAAAAFERAARLTDEAPRRAALLVDAARATWDAGNADEAQRLLDAVRAGAAGAPWTRLEAEWLAGRIAVNRGPVMQGHAILMVAAELALTELGAEQAIAILTDASAACFLACDTQAFATTARRVLEILPASASPATRLRAAVTTGVERIIGGDAAPGANALREAVAITDSHPELFEDPALLQWLAMGPLFLRESRGGGAHVELALTRARERAAIGSLAMVLGLSARDQAASDRARLGEATYREAITLSRESDQRTCLVFALSGLAWLQARQGREHECRANAVEALALAGELGARLHALWSLTALGELELGLGRPREALGHFEQQRELAEASAISDVDLWPAAEMVEAHLRLGRDEDARRLTVEFRQAAEAKGQPWALARALRCEGLVAANDAFSELFEQALRHNEQTPDVFELGRTHLAYGERLRRARNRVLARVQLRRAEELFTALDAQPWAARARAELEATGETLRSGESNTIEELTPQELQIAMMLASGRTTRETAAALFLSPKTIEYHLRHIYLKLGIHSREELARVVGLRADGLTQDAATEKTGGSRVAAVSPEPKRSPEVAPK